jgi:dihydrofolate reductase
MQAFFLVCNQSVYYPKKLVNMLVSMIVARGKNNVIGVKGEIPWRLPADLAYFKQTTMGHHLLMGRKTYESIGKPLPGRPNLVISRNMSYQLPACRVFSAVQEGIAFAKASGETELFVIGGGEIYKACFPLADKLYITEVDIEVQGDTFFEIQHLENWNLATSEVFLPDSKNPFGYRFTIWQKKQERSL